MSKTKPGWFPDPTDNTRWRWWDGNRWAAAVSKDGQVEQDPLPMAPSPANRSRVPVWVWVLVGLSLIMPVLLFSPVVALFALVVLITAIVGLSTGSRTWIRLRSRRAAIGVIAGAASVLLVSGSVAAAVFSGVSDAPTLDKSARFAGTSEVDAPDVVASVPTPEATPSPVTTTREEAVSVVIPFERTTVEDAGRPRGETLVTQAGQDGQRTQTYLVTFVDGAESSRELKTDVVTVEPITEVTTNGTYDAPPPPPPPPAAASTCDSNYADACVPIAGDVDCAWGSGNGPAYFNGVARVVGADIYGLDRDGDGWACER